MNFFKRRKRLRRLSVTDLIPVRSRGHEMENDNVIVLVPKFESGFYHIFSDRLKKLFFRIRLDKIGSAAWQSMDGERNVGQITEYLKRDPSLNQSDLADIDNRLSKYISMLYERRFITFRQLMED